MESLEDREYSLKHLPIHLLKAGEIEELQQLLEDREFLDEAIKVYGVDWLAQPEISQFKKTVRENNEQ